MNNFPQNRKEKVQQTQKNEKRFHNFKYRANT